LGVPAAGNIPGGRYGANSWTDQSGHLWLFGGAGSDANDGYGRLNDLWEFNPSTNQWAWISGGNTASQPGVYGKLGVSAAGNVPGSRKMATSWTDNSGHLWLFGGVGYDPAVYQEMLNDLWEFNPSTNQWTWMGGSSTIPCETFCGVPGAYGTLGTPAAGIMPGSRGSAMSWTDSGGNLWLFGGVGYDANGNEGPLNDLWEFNPSTNQWAWMGGSSALSCANGSCGGFAGVYGTLGVPAAGNNPGGRWSGSNWTDKSGHLWLFGGLGRDANANFGDLNDFWEFDPATNQWAWMGGSSTMIYENGAGEYSQPGVYETLGVPAAGNIPGGRDSAVSWTDSSGNFWLFGGQGADASGNGGPRNDLWKFNPSTSQWTWTGGSSQIPCVVLYQGVNDPLIEEKCGVNGVYGTLGTPVAGNLPGSRFSSVSWTDSSGNLWLFGGAGLGSTGGIGDLNDLWVYQP
jgi:N-acetylneuraminic acid mutarotase